jgi:hypothetical protein
MADFVYNIAKGRVVEYYNRVENNDPSASALIVVVIDTATADATLKDLDDLGLVIADGGTTERNANGWTRKTLTDTELASLPAPDDTNDRYEVDIPDQTWTSVTAGNATDLVICYDSDTGSGTDTNVIPLTQHDFIVTPDGSDVTAQIASTGFFRAAE